MGNIFDSSSLVDRIFRIFSQKSYSEIADILGVSKGTIGGWRNGASIPRLPELEKICELSKTNWEWLISGRTADITAITYAYFPLYTKEGTIIRQENYNKSRVLAGIALAHKGFDNKTYKMATVASAGHLYYSKNKVAHNPEERFEILHAIRSSISDEPASELQLTIESCLNPSYLDDVYCESDIPDNILNQHFDLINMMYKDHQTIQHSYYIHKHELSEEALALPDISPEDFREIPFYGDEIAAGQPLEMRDSPEGIVIVHKDWCKQPENMVAVRVSSTGTSMEPTIPAGAIVTIDTTTREPKFLLGQAVAIYKNGDGATIKRLTQTTKGWCGVPDNRDPINQVIMIEEGDRIVGRVNSVHYAL